MWQCKEVGMKRKGDYIFFRFETNVSSKVELTGAPCVTKHLFKSFFATKVVWLCYKTSLHRAISAMQYLLHDGLPRSVCVRRLCCFGVLRFAIYGTAKLMCGSNSVLVLYIYI
uniref:Uncharacterized protein n=1 Tax=Rhipicephalus zambeziensis TaxID=60191 RepID=A0A224Y548_9ACAR